MQIADFSEVTSVSFGDWQKDYLYKVSILAEPAALASAPKGDLDPQSIDAFLDSFPIPASKVSSQKRRWAGQWFMFSGKLETQNTVQVTCRYDTNNRLYKYLLAWHHLSGNEENAQAVPKSEYIGQIQMLLYKGDKETPSGTYFTLKNVWVPEISDLQLNKANDGLLTFTATLAFDKRLTHTEGV
jgi:hypothetical protein